MGFAIETDWHSETGIKEKQKAKEKAGIKDGAIGNRRENRGVEWLMKPLRFFFHAGLEKIDLVWFLRCVLSGACTWQGYRHQWGIGVQHQVWPGQGSVPGRPENWRRLFVKTLPRWTGVWPYGTEILKHNLIVYGMGNRQIGIIHTENYIGLGMHYSGVGGNAPADVPAAR